MEAFSLLGGQIRGLRWGSGKKVIALHGYLDNAMSFKLLAEQLPGIEVWAIDLPGHGLSANLDKNDGTFLLNWLPLLGRALDELAWDDYTLIGHSLGGVVATLLAGVDSRISELYCLDALGPLVSTSAENRDRFVKVYQQRQQAFPVHYYPSYERLVASRQKGLFPLSAKAAAVMAQRAVGYGRNGWFHRYDRQLRQESLWRLSEAEVLGWLSQINCPVYLALFSIARWEGHEEAFNKRLEAISDFESTPIEGSHHLHMENPLIVAQWLLDRLL